MSKRHGIKTCVCYENDFKEPSAYPVHIEYEHVRHEPNGREVQGLVVWLMLAGLDAINLGSVVDWPDWMREQVYLAIDADIEERREQDLADEIGRKE